MWCALRKKTRVPAGNALAVDRYAFSQEMTEQLQKFSAFTRVAEVTCDVEKGFDVTIVATGPLTDEALIPAFRQLFGSDFLYFFDAVAPIVTADSIDYDSAFSASRYGKGSADYLNCPMDKQQYDEFYDALVAAQTVPLKQFENNVFEGCMPIEVMAKRGKDTMRFGPLRPVGLFDERKGEKPYAVLQLRKENREGTLYNLVGFQTNLRYGEQKRVFSLIPALKEAEFVRYGVMHRNTYINAPKFLNSAFQLKSRPDVVLCGADNGGRGIYGVRRKRTCVGNSGGQNCKRAAGGSFSRHYGDGSAVPSRQRGLRRIRADERQFRHFAPHARGKKRL